MNKKILTLLIAITIGFSANAATQKTNKNVATKQPAKQTVQKAPQKPTVDNSTYYLTVNSLDVVANPAKYLNKNVKIIAKFDKFSNLGLDYKPAYKSSEEYITFLIRRNDVAHNIPLSEMKNFIKRKTAEKFIDLETDDEIEYTGTVFSNALGDVWIDVNNIKIIKKNPNSKR